MKSELVPHVDVNDNLIGTVQRAVAYKEGLIHRGVHAFLKNKEGKFLIQKRSDDKPSWPGHYDLSLAETVKPGESYENTLHRGLQEELGIKSPHISLIKPKYYQEYFWKEYKVFGILYLYLLSGIEEVHLVDGEVASSKWMSKEEVSNLLQDNSDKCTPWLIRDWQTLLDSM